MSGDALREGPARGSPVAIGQLPSGTAVTRHLATQFVGAGPADQPVGCFVGIVDKAGRVMVLRGTIEQGDHVVLSDRATLRKYAPRPV